MKIREGQRPRRTGEGRYYGNGPGRAFHAVFRAEQAHMARLTTPSQTTIYTIR